MQTLNSDKHMKPEIGSCIQILLVSPKHIFNSVH